MSTMSELHVRTNGQLVVLLEGDRLGFGRQNTDRDGVKGWGYEGRFIELSAKAHVHRLWGELVWDSGLWKVRSLGSMYPVSVEPAGQRPIELPPVRVGSPPSEYAVTDEVFDVVLSVAADSYRLECRTVGRRAAPAPKGPGRGAHTATLCDEMAERVTGTEFPVLWFMASEYRSTPPVPSPSPLSYSRICRALGLSERQAVSAVARAVGRFRKAELMPASVPSEEQRDWLCRALVTHGVFDELVRRYGEPQRD